MKLVSLVPLLWAAPALVAGCECNSTPPPVLAKAMPVTQPVDAIPEATSMDDFASSYRADPTPWLGKPVVLRGEWKSRSADRPTSRPRYQDVSIGPTYVSITCDQKMDSAYTPTVIDAVVADSGSKLAFKECRLSEKKDAPALIQVVEQFRQSPRSLRSKPVTFRATVKAPASSHGAKLTSLQSPMRLQVTCSAPIGNDAIEGFNTKTPTISGVLRESSNGVLDLEDCVLHNKVKGLAGVFDPSEIEALIGPSSKHPYFGKTLTVTGFYRGHDSFPVEHDGSGETTTPSIGVASDSKTEALFALQCVNGAGFPPMESGKLITVRGQLQTELAAFLLRECELIGYGE